MVFKWEKNAKKKKKVVQQDLILDWHQVKSNARKAIFEGVTTNLYILRREWQQSLCAVEILQIDRTGNTTDSGDPAHVVSGPTCTAAGLHPGEIGCQVGIRDLETFGLL